MRIIIFCLMALTTLSSLVVTANAEPVATEWQQLEKSRARVIWAPSSPSAPRSLPQSSPHSESHSESQSPIQSPPQSVSASDKNLNLLGLEIEMDRGWHTYFKYPGESGAPPRMISHTDARTDSRTAGGTGGGTAIEAQQDEIFYPSPKRLTAPPVVTFGYEKSVVFVQQPARQVKKLNVEYLVCEDICIPNFADFDLSQAKPVSRETVKKMQSVLATSEARQAARPAEVNTGADGGIAVSLFEGETALELIVVEPTSWTSHIWQSGVSIDQKQTNDQGLKDTLKTKQILWQPVLNALSTQPIGDQNAKPPPPLEPRANFFATLPSQIKVFMTVRRKGETATIPLSFSFASDTKSAAGSGSAFGDSNPNGENTNKLTDQNPLSLNSLAISELFKALAFAFIGGLLLNLMPCVFPVLSLKIFAVTKGHQGLKTSEVAGYTAGIVLTLWALGAALTLLRSLGEAVGWGFHLQSPLFVGLLAVTFLLLTLNLWGLWTVDVIVPSSWSNQKAKTDWAHHMWSGVIATLVATPCTAPFMGAALGYSLAAPAVVLFAVLAALGVGLALPFWILRLFPKLLHRLPRPGPWMETARVGFGFPLLATSLWLVWIYSSLTSADTAFLLLGSLTFVGFFIWARAQAKNRLWQFIFVAAAIACLLPLFFQEPAASEQSDSAGVSTAATATTTDSFWQKFSNEALAQQRQSGQPVFIDFTAAWCLSCKVNERITFQNDEIKNFIAQNKIIMLKADWTRRDPEITAILEKFGRAGVPFYLLYLPGQNDPLFYPEILTPAIFKDVFKRGYESLTQGESK